MNDQPRRSATDDLGSHLLGRKPMPKDDRDYKLQHDGHGGFVVTRAVTSEHRTSDAIVQSYHGEDVLRIPPVHSAVSDSPLDPSMTLQDVHDETDYFTNWKGILAFWRWVKSVFGAKPTPTPTPSPSPTPQPTPQADGTWADPENVLDQGQTPECVGACWAQWGNTLPIDDHYTNSDIEKIYLECKIIDGEPGQMDGSNTRSGAKAMQNRGRLTTYAFASSTATITAWLQQHGPVCTGTDWMNQMFSADADGYLRPTGGVAGGHEWLLVGYSPTGYGNVTEPSYTMQNSWGSSWARNGRAYIRVSDYARLLSQNGDACAAVELA